MFVLLRFLFLVSVMIGPMCFSYSPLSSMMTRTSNSFPQANVQTYTANQVTVDRLPIAIALTETIMSKFRGSEHESQVSSL